MGFLRRLLVAVDGSPSAETAIDFAVRLARDNDAEIVFCNAVNYAAIVAETTTPYGYTGAGDLFEALDLSAKEILNDAVERAKAGSVRASGFKLDGRADNAIVSYAVERQVDAIVLGTRGQRGLQRFFLGSTAEGVLRTAVVPVFVVHAETKLAPPEANKALRTIMVAVDDSEPSDAAAAFATELAVSVGGKIVFTHVIDEEQLMEEMAKYGGEVKPIREEWEAEGNTLVKTAAERAQAAGLSSVAREVVYGDPVASLLRLAEETEADLIAIGTHGRRGLRRLVMGSVAEAVVRRSPIPVLILRGSAELARGHKLYTEGETRAEHVTA